MNGLVSGNLMILHVVRLCFITQPFCHSPVSYVVLRVCVYIYLLGLTVRRVNEPSRYQVYPQNAKHWNGWVAFSLARWIQCFW
jgi:hypothetical protein